ncbi:hypothetical protein [Fodinibius halophilus]|uniref:TonB-dependent receptor n=1 Tax=Fodinibius halophilus TaxID=1736908 RepID=A0A6M1T224_9BACT|nr:hypothetical protein [Fodinibius halophilus]NGP87265.1 hypothetical protein [Fodinibius halophilus]
MKRSFLSVFVLLLTIVAATAVKAQDQQSGEGSLLPEIDPQDIEIRSQFKARFPGLRRQPILGFDPTPRVYQVDPNRMPFMETAEQVVADMPVSNLSRPEAPAYVPLHYSPDINMFSRAGIGSFMSPEVDFWGVRRLTSKSYIGGDLDYSSSSGHLDNQESSFRFLNATGEYVTKISSKNRIGFQLGVENSFNNMPNLQGLGTLDNARKKYGGFNLNADFEHFNNTISGWNVQANMRYYKIELSNAGNLYTGSSQEEIYNGSVAKRWSGSNVDETFTVKAGAKVGRYDNNTINPQDWLTAQAGVVYDRLFNYSTKVHADASIYYTQNGFTDAVYIGPSLKVKHPFMEMLTLTLKAEAKPNIKSIQQLHSENRFLAVNNNLRHSYRINGSVEAELEYNELGSMNFGVQYTNTSDRSVYIRQDGGRTTVSGESLYDFYSTTYADTYTMRAFVGATHQIVPEKLWVDAKFYMQSPQIKGGDRIPYEEKIGLKSGISFRPLEQLSIEGWGDYVGSRQTFQTNEELSGYFLLGSRADYQITDRFGAYVKLVNLLNQEYEVWQGYTERSFQAYGGITVKL